jgi:hypothetical protein
MICRDTLCGSTLSTFGRRQAVKRRLLCVCRIRHIQSSILLKAAWLLIRAIVGSCH